MDGKENLSLRAYLAIGMMLFALFFVRETHFPGPH